MQNRTRNNQIIVRLDDKELADLNEKIKKSGLTKTDFFIKASSNQNIIIVEDLKEICIELKKQGINLNQALKHYHEIGASRELEESIKNCNYLYEKLTELYISTENKISKTRKIKK